MSDIVKVTTFKQDISDINEVSTKAFLVTGKLLSNIQKDKKYKEVGYKTFKEAIKSELGLEESRAYQLIRAADSYSLLYNCTVFAPTAEAQLRPLIGLEEEQQVDVWQVAAKDGIPTAKQVKECVNELYPKPVKAVKKKEDVPIVVDIPVVDTITLDQEVEINTLKIRVLELETSNEELVNTMLDQEAEIIQLKEQLKGYQPQVDVNTTTPTGQILREIAYSFIEKYGNTNQMKALEVLNLTNEKMFVLFKAVRAKVLETTPPQMLPKEITEATEII